MAEKLTFLLLSRDDHGTTRLPGPHIHVQGRCVSHLPNAVPFVNEIRAHLGEGGLWSRARSLRPVALPRLQKGGDAGRSPAVGSLLGCPGGPVLCLSLSLWSCGKDPGFVCAGWPGPGLSTHI